MRQHSFQNKRDPQCKASVSVQVPLTEGRVVGLVSIRLFSNSWRSGTYQLNICHYKFQLIFPSAERRSWKSVACVSLLLCFSVVCGLSICMSTVGDPSHGLPVHRASSHVPLSMYVRVDVSPGIPLCRASQLFTIWLPAWAGLHVSYSVFITGPPALPGFPCTYNKASGKKPASMCM